MLDGVAVGAEGQEAGKLLHVGRVVVVPHLVGLDGHLGPRPPQTWHLLPAAWAVSFLSVSQSWALTSERTFLNQQVRGTSSIVRRVDMGLPAGEHTQDDMR